MLFNDTVISSSKSSVVAQKFPGDFITRMAICKPDATWDGTLSRSMLMSRMSVPDVFFGGFCARIVSAIDALAIIGFIDAIPEPFADV
jgi:hypothetical protein